MPYPITPPQETHLTYTKIPLHHTTPTIPTLPPTPSLVKKQLAYILGRQQVFLDIQDPENQASLNEIISNAHYNNNFLALAREVFLLALLYCRFHSLYCRFHS